eukprot:3774003-Pleurochrysis_carterae.AAC.4
MPAQPPKAIRLEASEIEGNVADCLGLYRLVDGRLVNGLPAWRHTRFLDKWYVLHLSRAQICRLYRGFLTGKIISR